MNKREQDYLKAFMYDALSQYYKYSNPDKYIDYYQKHLKYMRRIAGHGEEHRKTRAETARLILTHTAPDIPSVDVYINNHLVFQNFTFKMFSNPLELPEGSYYFDIYPAGNSVSTIISKKIKVKSGEAHLLATAGLTNRYQLLSFPVNRSIPEGEAKLRFLNLSPNSQGLDFAVTGGDVVFPNIPYKQLTDYLGLSPMTVNLELRKCGTKQIILPLPSTTFKPDASYTLVAVGCEEGENASPFSAFLIQEF